MLRLVVGGPPVRRFDPGPFTDAYVRLVFPPPGVSYPDGADMRRIHAGYPPAARPRTRTYTVRRLDRAAGELTLDLVDHGRPSLTASWLATLHPGDPVLVQAPRGLYRPRGDVDWHLLAGDATALPAIAVTLAAMAPGARARVVLEVVDAADEQPLPTAAAADIRWVHAARGECLTEAVRALPFERGAGQAFVHGEGGAVPALRRHLLDERGIARELLSISGYWRRGLDDGQWRRLKAAGVQLPDVDPGKYPNLPSPDRTGDVTAPTIEEGVR